MGWMEDLGIKIASNGYEKFFGTTEPKADDQNALDIARKAVSIIGVAYGANSIKEESCGLAADLADGNYSCAAGKAVKVAAGTGIAAYSASQLSTAKKNETEGYLWWKKEKKPASWWSCKK